MLRGLFGRLENRFDPAIRDPFAEQVSHAGNEYFRRLVHVLWKIQRVGVERRLKAFGVRRPAQPAAVLVHYLGRHVQVVQPRPAR